MNENQAKTVAAALGAQPWQSGGGIWLVVFTSPPKVIAISEDGVTEYADWDDFYAGKARTEIEFGQ